MSQISKQAAYLRGLAEGLGIGDESKEHRIMTAIIALLEEMATRIDEGQAQIETLTDNLETVVEDVCEMQDLLLEDIDDFELLGGDDDDEPMEEIACVSCGDSFLVERETMLAERELACPNCGSMIELDKRKIAF